MAPCVGLAQHALHRPATEQWDSACYFHKVPKFPKPPEGYGSLLPPKVSIR
jgi:hypothetical protein